MKLGLIWLAVYAAAFLVGMAIGFVCKYVL